VSSLSSKSQNLREIKNILSKYWLTPIFIYFVVEIFRFLQRRVISRYPILHKFSYPKELKNLVKELNFGKKYAHDIKNSKTSPNKIFTIELITFKLNSEIKDIWKLSFDDNEEFLYLHRWHWLLNNSSIKENNKEDLMIWGVYQIRSWIRFHKSNRKLPPMDAYSIGERISNSLLFFRHCSGSWNNVPEDIKSNITQMVGDLVTRIEYYPNDLGGNHVLNNARAIILASYTIQNNKLLEVGKFILFERLEKIFDNHGFCREGSSHYHFLLTRWLLEIRMASVEFDDLDLVEKISVFINRALKALEFFIVSTKKNVSFPLYGDISPDCPPDWLKNLIFSKLVGYSKHSNSSDWASLYKNFELPKKYEQYEDKEITNNKDWTRVDFKGWNLIIHHEDTNRKSIASHAHSDFSAFVLYYQGKELLIDPGRYSYSGSREGFSNEASKSHNIINIDMFPPSLSKGDRLLPKEYKNKKFSIKITKLKNKVLVIMEHTGFKRLKSKVNKHIRTFEIYENKFVLKDNISGDGIHLVEQFFHFGDVLSNNNNNLFEKSFSSYPRLNRELINITSKRSNSYLHCKPYFFSSFSGRVKLPFKSNFQIRRI